MKKTGLELLKDVVGGYISDFNLDNGFYRTVSGLKNQENVMVYFGAPSGVAEVLTFSEIPNDEEMEEAVKRTLVTALDNFDVDSVFSSMWRQSVHSPSELMKKIEETKRFFKKTSLKISLIELDTTNNEVVINGKRLGPVQSLLVFEAIYGNAHYDIQSPSILESNGITEDVAKEMLFTTLDYFN